MNNYSKGVSLRRNGILNKGVSLRRNDIIHRGNNVPE